MEAIVELKQRMFFLERAHASARMGHFVLDPKRMTIEFSSWVRDNVGFNNMPIPVDRLADIIPEDDREIFAQTVNEVIKAEDEFEFEVNIYTAKGELRTQRVTGIPAYENQASRTGLIAFYGILQEVTREKETRRGLLKARDAAREQLEARTNILAAVSHEIRTPLSGILGIIDQLKRERSATERERALTLIEESCEVLLDTLDAILQQSRIDQQADALSLKRFSPGTVAQRVAELFRPLARRKALRIEVRVDEGREVMGDPARIQQILSNFVSNAVKFTQAGAVTIVVREPPEGAQDWAFIITDTGSGMDQGRVDTIFEPFGETSDDTLGRAVGAGLGLSITRDLVEAMNGRIEVASEPGKGSTFKILIPFAEVEQTGAQSDEIERKGQALILIDRATDAVQAEAVFSQFGYEIATLEDLLNARQSHEESVAVIADAVRLNDVPPDLIDQCDHLIGLASEEEHLALAEALGEDVSLVASNNLARSLKNILGDKAP